MSSREPPDSSLQFQSQDILALDQPREEATKGAAPLGRRAMAILILVPNHVQALREIVLDILSLATRSRLRH